MKNGAIHDLGYVPIDSQPGELGRVTRADVVAEARAWLDVPFVHQGRSRHGLDCAGLPIVVARSLGLVAPDFDVNGYDRAPDGKSLLEWCGRFMVRIPLDEKLPGMVLVLHWRIGRAPPQHLGVLGDYMHGGLSLIHARSLSDGTGSVVEHRLDVRTLALAVAAYALPGVEA